MSEVYLTGAPSAARIQYIQYRVFNGKTSALNPKKNTRGDYVYMKDIDLVNIPLAKMYVIRPTLIAGRVQIFDAWVDMPLELGDIIYTGRDVISNLEFFIGGKVTIGSQKIVVVNSERSVREYSTSDSTSPQDISRAVFETFRYLISPSKDREAGMKITGGLGIRG